ncbi:MAG TPA: hypothetical protein VFU86_15135 [Terriglobales bacterium]|nr:hypothetical protein [Terriglobales bacterium]
MLTIRQEQLAILQNHAASEYLQRMVEHLLEEFPENCKALGGRAQVEAFAKRALAGAQRHGVTTKGPCLTFVELVLQYGDDFERSPIREWIHNILAHPVLPGDAKVGFIGERIAEQTQGRTLIAY